MRLWSKLSPERKHQLFLRFIIASGTLTAVALIGKVFGLLSTDVDSIISLIAMVLVLIAASLM